MADKDLAGRVVVLTGAATGIGRETAALLAQHGARMVLADNDEQTLPPLADELGALAVPCDVADYAQVCRLAERAARHFGRIDAWVNNAGVTVYGSVEELQMTEIRRVIEVNLFDTQRTDQADDGRDNLDRPMPGPARSTGLFGRRARSKSWYTKVLGMHPNLGRLLVGAGAVAVLVAARAAGRRA